MGIVYSSFVTMQSAVFQRIAYCITPEHEHHLVAEGNIRQFTVMNLFRAESEWTRHNYCYCIIKSMAFIVISYDSLNAAQINCTQSNYVIFSA